MLSKLSELRKSKGLSQIELAKILNVNQNTISRWENGDREPNPDMLKTIANYFQVSVDYLLENEPLTNKKIPKDLRKILEEEEVTLNGRMMSAEDKEKIYKVIEAMYYDAKEQNRRK